MIGSNLTLFNKLHLSGSSVYIMSNDVAFMRKLLKSFLLVKLNQTNLKSMYLWRQSDWDLIVNFDL